MAKDKELKEIKTTTLISVVVHGANPFGVKLAETIAGQGSKVIVIDEFSKETKSYVEKLKKNDSIDFVAFEGMQELYETLDRFDYLFYLQFTSLDPAKSYGSKDFLKESDRVDKTLEASLKHKAKVAIVTSLTNNKELVEITQLEEGKPKPYSELEIQRYTETITAEQYDKSNLNVRIIRIGALLGDGFDGFDDPVVQELFSDSASKDRLTIKGEGLDNHYVVHAEDAVFGILKLTFNPDTNGEVVTLSLEKPLTTLSVAYKLLELNPEASRIEFEDDDSKVLYQGHYAIAPNASKYEWKAKYNIEECFMESLAYVYTLNKKTWKSDKEQPSAKKKSSKNIVQTVKTPFGEFMDKLFSPFTFLFAKSKDTGKGAMSIFNWKGILVFIIALVIFLSISYFILTPVINIGYGGYQAAQSAREAYDQAQALDLTTASENFDEANQHLETVETGLVRLEWLFKITGQEDFYENSYLLLSAGDYATRGAKDMTYALEPFALYFNEFNPALDFDSDSPTTTEEYRDHLNEMKARRFQLVKAAESIEYASQLIGQVDAKVFPERVQPYVDLLKTNNSTLASAIKPFQETIYFLPELLGVEERQRYLILLQNPSEIRSTGGWLSSYAIIGIEGGQIRQLEVDDVYNIDGALRVQDKRFEAPESMQNALDVQYWSLSTSNWNPDFPQASDDSEFFIREAGKAFTIDGAIAININVVEALLDYWGEINVPGEDQPITSENLQEKISEIHEGFEPGSDRKSTFIASLANEVITKLLKDKENYFDIGTVLLNSMDQKDILVNLSNSGANAFFASQNWDGALDPSYQSAPLPVEWNWGANKANLFIDSNTSVKIKVNDKDSIRYSYTLSVKNNSTTNTYPEGEYEDWHRIYIPENATLEQFTGFEGNIDEYVENGFKVIGGWFKIPSNATNQLSVTYDVNRKQGESFPITEKDDNLLMDLDFYKQPGLYPGQLKIEVEYPDSWAIIEDGGLNRGINLLSSQFEQTEDYNTKLTWEYK